MIYLIIFIMLVLLELVYFRLAKHFNIVDRPNNRSSHSVITIRGGGIIFYFSVLLYFILVGFHYPWFFSGFTLIALISFIDDIKPISNKFRLLVHIISFTFMFYEWNLFSMPWYFSIIVMIVIAGILNAFNFMDGINGITGAYSLITLISLWYINMFKVPFVDNQLLYIIGLSLVVFNFFNFRSKAICFAGDIGAISIAFIILFLLGKLIIYTSNISYIVLLVVYGVDSVLTIIHRLFLKENIFKPHRKHAFQIMANELKLPHLYVAFFYALLQLIINFGILFFLSYSYLAIVIILLSITYIFFKIKFFHLHVR